MHVVAKDVGPQMPQQVQVVLGHPKSCLTIARPTISKIPLVKSLLDVLSLAVENHGRQVHGFLGFCKRGLTNIQVEP